MRTAKIPETIFELGLSPGAFAVFAVFLLHRNRDGFARPGRATIKRMSGVGVNQLKSKMDELEGRGLIRFHRRLKPSNVDEYAVELPQDGVEMESLFSESMGGDGITIRCEMESLNSDRGIYRNQRIEPTGASAPVLPFSSDRFREAWGDWEKHRKEIRKKLTPTSVRKQFKELTALGEQRAIAAIEHSITKGWQGIFEPSPNTAATTNGNGNHLGNFDLV